MDKVRDIYAEYGRICFKLELLQQQKIQLMNEISLLENVNNEIKLKENEKVPNKVIEKVVDKMIDDISEETK